MVAPSIQSLTIRRCGPLNQSLNCHLGGISPTTSQLKSAKNWATERSTMSAKGREALTPPHWSFGGCPMPEITVYAFADE